MNKRLEKRHKRQVTRAREKVKLSEPDVRTPEQIAAAREASRAVGVVRHDPHANYSTPTHGAAAPAAPAKDDSAS